MATTPDERRSASRAASRAMGRMVRVLAVAAQAAVAACGIGDSASGVAERAGDSAASHAPLLVFAASDLQRALPELARGFEQATGRRVELVFGSTGNLATQVEHGAHADLFFAASEVFLDRLAAAGRIHDGSRRAYAVGRLALVAPPSATPPPDPAALADPAVRTVAIAHPEHAPYGAAARAALQRAGVWARVRPRLVLGENVVQAYQFVRTGNADAGLVALSLAVELPAGEYRLVDARLHPPLRQEAAVLRGSPRADAAGAFLDHVTGDEGQAILRRHGFEAPDAP